MNRVFALPDGLYMEVPVNGKVQNRKCNFIREEDLILKDDRPLMEELTPILEDGEELCHSVSGSFEIVNMGV